MILINLYQKLQKDIALSEQDNSNAVYRDLTTVSSNYAEATSLRNKRAAANFVESSEALQGDICWYKGKSTKKAKSYNYFWFLLVKLLQMIALLFIFDINI